MLHLPVLLQEVLEAYKDKEISVFLDATTGAAGHSLAILQAHPEIEYFIAFDQDQRALDIAKEKLRDYHTKTLFIHANFSEMFNECKKHSISRIDGILMDIGVSSMQIDQGQRGFSFLKDGPLDMRMNPEKKLDAKTVVNEFDEKDLSYIFKEFGEEKHHRALAKRIVEKRKEKSFESTLELSDVIADFFGKRGKIHPATKVFQALRIYVNDELGNLSKGLEAASQLLAHGGLLSVISFHSLEDRIVKNFMRQAAAKRRYLPEGFDDQILKDPIFEIVNKKPIVATKEEEKQNPRSRSAKLRIARRV